MSFTLSQLTNTGLFFLFIFLSGFWLNRARKPYNVLLITVHKLIGLAVGIYLGLTIHRIQEAAPLSTIQIAVIVTTVLFFVVNVVTGSLLSTNKAMPRLVSTINKFFPYLTVLSTAGMVYLLT